MKKVFALSANYGYISPVTTLVKSIVKHNHNSKIYWINCDVPQEWFDVVNYRIKQYGCKIIDIKLDPGMLDDLYASHEHINVMSFGRILIPKLIPEDKVLYLDSDIVVTQDLTNLFNIDLGNYYLAAVPNIVQEDDHPTFNSGTVLFNNQKFREHPEALQQMLDEGKGNHNLREGDQTLLNDLTGDDYYKLPFRYNYIIGYDQFSYYQFANHYMPYVNAINDSQHDDVVHFASPDKPWKLLSSTRMRSAYWQYANIPWSFQTFKSTKPQFKGKLLICTNSADIFNLQKLILALPDYQFNICAWVNVAWPLQELVKHPNVHVYQRVIPPVLDKLAQECNAYLDIATGAKEQRIPERFLNIGKPVLTFDAVWNHNLPESQYFHAFDNDKCDEMVKLIPAICRNSQEGHYND